MPRLIVPRLQVMLRDVAWIKTRHPYGDRFCVIVAAVNGDGSKYASVEPPIAVLTGELRAHSSTRPLYEQPIEDGQTAYVRFIFGEREQASVEAHAATERAAQRLAHSPALALPFAGLLPTTGADLGPVTRIGEVTLTVQRFGDALSPMLTFGAGAAPQAEAPPEGSAKRTWRDRLRALRDRFRLPDIQDLDFGGTFVESASFPLDLGEAGPRYRAELFVSLVTRVAPRLDG